MSITINIDTMSTDEKVELISQLWNSIDEDTYSVPKWQQEILKERIEEHEKNPDSGRPWETIRRELLNR